MQTNNKKNIGFISESDPFADRVAWSGTLFKIRESLENAGFNVVWIPVKSNTFIEKVYKACIKLYSKFFCQNKLIVLGVHRPFIAKLQAKMIKKNAVYHSCDAFFFAGGGQRALYMDLFGKPVIYYTDATFHIMAEYYWKNLDESSKYESMELEKSATQLAALNLRSSEWAAKSVVKDCEFDPRKNFVLEFGANLDDIDISPIDPYQEGSLNLLFSGVDWDRKGGDIAVKTTEILRANGIDAKLTVTGIRNFPQKYKNLSFILNLGFLNKNNPDDYKKYVECWKHSHAFILPTRAECSAIVYCEAAAFGVPTYTYLTGGTANYVIDGVNGYALPYEASAEEFANKIIFDIKSGNMKNLHQSALKLYHERLSWKAWSNRFKAIVDMVGLFND